MTDYGKGNLYINTKRKEWFYFPIPSPNMALMIIKCSAGGEPTIWRPDASLDHAEQGEEYNRHASELPVAGEHVRHLFLDANIYVALADALKEAVK